jgi:hypothetical protein
VVVVRVIVMVRPSDWDGLVWWPPLGSACYIEPIAGSLRGVTQTAYLLHHCGLEGSYK